MKRIYLYDNIKGLLILFVVLGHTLNICASYYKYNFSWFKIFTFFMIPLFVYIMGKFAKKSRKKPLTRTLRMLKIYILMQIITTIYYAFFLKIISPTKSLLEPRFTLWYLLTSAYFYLSIYLLRKVKFKTIFILSCILAIGSGFLSFITNSLSLTRTLALMPFFIIGYYEEQLKIEELAKKYQKLCNILAIIIMIWFLFNQNFFTAKDTYLKYNYYTYSTPMTCFIKRIILYLFFIIFSISIFNIIPHKKTILSKLGNKTLAIYLTHGLLLKTIKYYHLFYDNYILGTIITYLLVLILGLSIYYFLNYIKKKGGDFIEKYKIRSPKNEIQNLY